MADQSRPVLVCSCLSCSQGTDPEVADQSDNTFSRRDYYVFPTYRTFLASLRLGF